MNANNKNFKISVNLEIGNKFTRKYVSQKNYKKEMSNRIEPYLKKIFKSGYIMGRDHIKLYYEKFILDNSKANIIICHGLGEFTEKYYELIYYFINEGYSVFIIEHRGHGYSQRLGIDNFQISVEDFNYYCEDFKKFIDEIVIPSGRDKELLLFAHSMGGAIGTIFLERYTEYFKAAVLSSPMHEINTGRFPKIIAYLISNGMKLLGKENKYLPGQAPYKGVKEFPSRSTSCRERYEYMQEKIKNNSKYHSGGTSVSWYIKSLKATRELIKEKNASKVKIPILIFQAEYDTHVIPKAQNKFAKCALNCKVISVKGSKHEPYFETDDILFPFVDKVLLFYYNSIN
jgi:lysophospholipase